LKREIFPKKSPVEEVTQKENKKQREKEREFGFVIIVQSGYEQATLIIIIIILFSEILFILQ